jgi:hypothetical protein
MRTPKRDLESISTPRALLRWFLQVVNVTKCGLNWKWEQNIRGKNLSLRHYFGDLGEDEIILYKPE